MNKEQIKVAVALGTYMGMTAQESVDEYRLMLKKVSIPRLDKFGISAKAVIDMSIAYRELDPTLDKKDAIRLATNHIARECYRRLNAVQ